MQPAFFLRNLSKMNINNVNNRDIINMSSIVTLEFSFTKKNQRSCKTKEITKYNMYLILFMSIHPFAYLIALYT
ncbi:hypothetical protein C7M22_00574 [Bacillus velezensis]|nr:hypothetical protein C7M19_01373 [Bacillus velezensis]QHK11937.1 hypothetical protein C7M20_03091 [Bacillus velezensis]QHK14281.1 hypothetical protein C7M21_01520 [Bacillus velezensis]QHK62702.1 hypothetical protein C7M22_00574 [Bacillus velezensis]QHL95161.1 hypothetical protein C7M24_03177 [Bacillus velezensis]